MAPSITIPTADQINAMTDTEHKVYENRLRRMAARQRLLLEKSRRRDTFAPDYNTYRLVDQQTGQLVAGDQNTGYGMALDDIHRALTEKA
jgi:hypothetical protein